MTKEPLKYIFRGDVEAGFFIHALHQGTPDPLVRGCHGNLPPLEGPYICVVPVKDYWRMIAAMARLHNVRHYADVLEPQILDDMRARRCVLILDLSNEGPAYAAEIFDELFRWIEGNNLPAGQVVWLAQNRNMGARCRDSAGARAELIQFEYYDFFVKMMAVLFAPGANQQIVDINTGSLADRMFDPGRKDRLLLCLNATPRIPRVLTVSALIYHGLLEGSLVSFPGLNYVKDPGSVDDVTAYIDANPSLDYLRASLVTTLGLSDLRVDEFSEKGNALFAKVDVRPYERTFFSLVTETEFTDGSVHRITEKIVKPFCLGHPALIVGNPHSVEFMTELGFLDWGHMIDRTYESEPSPAKRFGLLFDEVRRQAYKIRTNPNDWLGLAREIGTANMRHAAEGKLLSRYREIYDHPVIERLARMVGHPT